MGELLAFLTTHEEQFRRNRLTALYSDFRHLRTINPDGYAANIEAWRKGLANAARGGHISGRGPSSDHLVLNVDERLLRALETKEWGRPLALGTVVRDAMLKKEMVPLQEFLTAKESIYHKSWTVTPWDIVSWGIRQLGLTGSQSGEDKLPTGKLVILSNIEEASMELARRVSGHSACTERIYSKKLFCEAFANVLGDKNLMSQADIDVLLKFMARDKAMLAYDGQTIKFKGHTETGVLSITSEDATIASLKTLMADLEIQVDNLTQRVEALSTTARDAVSRNNRVSAIAALRSKKLAESNLSRQSATLGQLEEVYSKISQAADQVELIRIMEGSTGALRALNAEVGGVERVDDVVDQLKEQMTQVDEIGYIITEVSQGGTVVNDDEVDGELEAMEREDEQKKKEAESLEKQERERQEAAETKRKLDSLVAVERHAAQDRREAAKGSSEAVQSLDADINKSTLELGWMSLEE